LPQPLQGSCSREGHAPAAEGNPQKPRRLGKRNYQRHERVGGHAEMIHLTHPAPSNPNGIAQLSPGLSRSPSAAGLPWVNRHRKTFSTLKGLCRAASVAGMKELEGLLK